MDRARSTGRSRGAGIGALVALSLGMVGASATGARAQGACPTWEGLVVGHRGSGVSSDAEPYPENTLVSFEAAFDEGADAVELDIHLSSDGVPVIMHDASVDITTDGTGCVGDLTAAELGALDAGGPNMLGMGVGVPTLAELLEATAGGLNIELKVEEAGGACPATDRAALAAAVVAALDADPEAGSRAVWISSFDAEVLSEYRLLDADTPVSLLTFDPADVAVAAAAGFDGVSPLLLIASPELVEEAHAAGLTVWVWTIATEASARSMAAMGVDAIITDDVSAALSGALSVCSDGSTSAGGGCSVANPGRPPGIPWAAGLLFVAFAWLRSRRRRTPRGRATPNRGR